MSYYENYEAPGVHPQPSIQQAHPPQSYPPPGQGQCHQGSSAAPTPASYYPKEKGLDQNTQQVPSPDPSAGKTRQKATERACCFYFAHCIACCCQCLAALSY